MYCFAHRIGCASPPGQRRVLPFLSLLVQYTLYLVSYLYRPLATRDFLNARETWKPRPGAVPTKLRRWYR